MKQFLFLLLATAAFSSYGQSAAPQEAPVNTAAARVEKQFPFVIDTADKEFDLSIHIMDQTVAGKYNALFTQYGLSYDVETWQEVIAQMLQKWLPYISGTLSFFDDDKILYMKSGNAIYRQNMIETLRPILYDKGKMEEFLKNMDRTNLE